MRLLSLLALVASSVGHAQGITVPELRGMSESAARTRLTEAGLRGKVHAETVAVDTCEHRDVPVGTVCRQSTRAGAEVSPALDVWLSLRGENRVGMLDLPALRDLTEARARQRLAERGFTGSITTKTVRAADCNWTGLIRSGSVCGMTPDPGQKHPADVAVQLHVLGAYEPSDAVGLVPEVVKLPLAEAVARLAAQRFEDPTLRFLERDGCVATVCESSPEAGTPVRRTPGSVLLFIGTRFPGRLRADRMPDLSGDSLGVAWDKLDALAFRGSISISSDTTRCVTAALPGLVCGQSPAAGAALVRTGNSQSPAVLFMRPRRGEGMR